MKITKIFLIFLISILSLLVSADMLTINISSQTKPGVLNLAIYNDPAAYNESVKGEKRSEKGIFYGIESFIDLQAKHEFIIDIPDGTYAIALFVDTNNNLKIDKNLIGIPKEQYGFSNNAMGNFSAPSYEQAMFQVTGKTIQNIVLK